MSKLKVILCVFLLSICIVVYASPSNDSFIDDELYSCIIDAYNSTFNQTKDASYKILPEELIQIKALDCSKYSGKIENLTGLNKLLGLTSLNLSGNLFLGGSLKLANTAQYFKSNLNLPSNLTITDKTYKIDNTKIVKVVDDKAYPLEEGSTYVTMTGKVSGNTITEKYLVVVEGGTVKRSNNSKLSSLYLSKGEFNFDSNVKNYTTVVDKNVDSVTITATLSDKKASFINNFGPRKVKLDIGTNTILVKVKAEDNTESTYTINVIRSDGNDKNYRLANIELTVGKIDFSPDIYNYNFNVESNVDSIDVKGVPESSLAKVMITDIDGNSKEDKITSRLKVGTNKIVIKVISESNDEKSYTLIITREDYDSTENYLKNIVIKDYNLNFSRDKFDYELNITNESKLVINPELENLNSSFVIEGNEDLKNNSKIIIRVSDKEGSTRDYRITIHKSSLIDTYYIKIGLIVFEFLLIFIFFIKLIVSKNNKPRKPKKVKRKNNKTIAKNTNNINNNNINTRNVSCRMCGTINDSSSKTCYVCGNKL